MTKLKPSTAYFLAFTGIFAVLAGFVFWGTWGTDHAPVMPDHNILWPPDYAVRLKVWWADFARTGRFIPTDLFELLGSPYWWQEFKYAFCLYLSGLGMAYWLKGRGLSYLSACSGGLLLGFCGYWCTLFSAGHYGWFQLIAYGIFAFGLIDRALDTGRKTYWALLGAVLAWGSMHQPDIWLLFTLLAFAYFVFAWVEKGMKIDWSGWATGLAALLLIGAPSFLNAGARETAGRDKQIEESGQDRWTFVTNWSMPPEDTLEFFVPRVHGDTSCRYTLYYAKQAGKDTTEYTGRLGRPLKDGKEVPRANYRQHSLYVGWVTCILAILGAALEWKKGIVKFLLAAGLAAYLFSLGRYLEPVYRLVFAMPMGDYLRAPVKWHHLTEFCLVALAAFGVGALEEKFNKVYFWLVPLVLLGAADLARVDAKYCAPVPLSGMRYRYDRSAEARTVPPVETDHLALMLGLVSVLTTIGVAYGAVSSARSRHS